MMDRLIDVTLDEATHVYSDSRKQKYDSVTTILGHYKEKFDPYKIMPDGGTLIGNYVLKHGETEEYWLKKWDEKRDHACARGTAWHKIKESVHNNLLTIERPKLFTVRDIEEELDRNPGIDYSKLPDGSYRELTLFNRRFMIAGQADHVIKDGKYVDIDDDKTNGDFKTISFKPPRGNYKMMLRPLQKFMDCHLYHYTMQLSTYGWMLEQFGLIPRQLRLLHYQIMPEHEERILQGLQVDIEPTLYYLNYEKPSVEAMIHHYTTFIRKR